MKLQVTALLLAFGLTAGVQAMDWNEYNDSDRFAPSAMHQGNYLVQRVETARVQYSRGPLYVITVKQFAVSPDDPRNEKGSIRYRVNYDTKEVWVYQNDTQEWLAIAAEMETERKALDKIFMHLYGIPFFTEE